ncbi:MAG: O-antigen ligase family protein [Candidatus Acidiferrales bacterium]
MNGERAVHVFPLGNLPVSAWQIAALITAIAVGFEFSSLGFALTAALAWAFGIAAAIASIFYPELALAFYVVVGDVKGDDRIASLLPVDLTIALGAILLIGIAVNLLRKKPMLSPPPVYFLYVVLVAIMAASLTYTLMLDAGIEKLGRFLTFTGIAIVAPFFVLGTRRAMTRFLAGFCVAAFAICACSLTGLGGTERLESLSGNTIGLGHVACALLIVIWFGAMPRLSFRRRVLLYPLLAVPAIALIGSGSRGSAIALALALLLCIYFYRRLALDLLCLAMLGLLALPLAGLPRASLDYLATLTQSMNLEGLLNFRTDLLSYGWILLQRHPLFGTGLGGYRYSSPNPGLYKWPHNIFLEVACEMGIPAAMLVFIIFFSAVREALRQATDRVTPGFTLSLIAAALLLSGIINGLNTGDINSDRLTWLFVALVFAARGLRYGPDNRAPATIESPHPFSAS